MNYQSTFISYAQNCEDVLLNRVFRDKVDGFYIDIGALHPTSDSVTKAFYNRGWCGINIEPIQEYYRVFCQDRSRDINLNIAVNSQFHGIKLERQKCHKTTINEGIEYELAKHQDEWRELVASNCHTADGMFHCCTLGRQFYSS